MGLRPFVNGRASVLASRFCGDFNMGRIMSTSALSGCYLLGMLRYRVTPCFWRYTVALLEVVREMAC